MKYLSILGLGTLFFLGFVSTCTPAEEPEDVLSLRGEWRWSFGDLLEGALPDFDDSSWFPMILPRDNFIPLLPENKGVVWFRYRIPSDQAVFFAGRELFFQSLAFSGPDEVYFNGVLVGSTGRFPPEPRFDWISRRNYRIPPGAWQEEGNVLAIRLYVDAEGWVAGPLELWPTDPAQRAEARYFLIKQILPLVLTVVLLMISGLFLFYQHKRPNEKEYLFFALASIALAVLILPQWHDQLLPFSPLDSRTVLALAMAGLFLFAPLLSLFLVHHLGLEPSPRRFLLTLPLPLLGALLVLFLPERFQIHQVRNLFFLAVPLFMILIFVDIFRALRNPDKEQRKKAWTMLLVFSLVALAAVYDMLSFSFGWLNMGIAYFIYTLPVLVTILSLQFVNGFVSSLNENERLRISFHRFVPEALIRLLGRQYLHDVQLGDAVEKRLAVVFTDIRNFTTLAESLDATQVFRFLNRFLGNLVPAIRSNQGFVDKYLGDGVLALFPESCDHAARAILDMQAALATMNLAQAEQGLEPIRMGIGAAFGDVIVGTVGETHRLEGTAVADTVNLAARLESLTKFYHTDVLVTEEFAQESVVIRGLPLRLVDRVCVKGKTHAVTLVEVLLTDILQPELWDQAMDLYFSGNFEEAQGLFEDFAQVNPQDHLAQLYLRRCQNNREQELDWPGFHLLDAK